VKSAEKIVRLPLIGAAGRPPARSADVPVPHAGDALVDPFARRVRYLRVSVTDRCNYRCTYCMPEDVDFRPRAELLTFEETTRIVHVFAEHGVKRVRLTGGEPTVRADLVDLVAMIAKVPGIDEVTMTTNGHLLADLAAPLAAAGLRDLNVSIDTVDAAKFKEVTRKGDLGRVIAGIDAARAAGLGVKLNAVALRGVNETEIADLCEFAWARGLVVRFIEHMPMSSGKLFAPEQELDAASIRAAVSDRFGALMSSQPGDRPRGPARYWQLASDPSKRVGIISAMTEHFCDTCNRVRLSATGELHACLGHDDAISLRDVVRTGGSDDDIRGAIAIALGSKRAGHEFLRTGVGAPTKHMVAIGG
jgi:cyclic pyranopterin phosphate synthase